MIQRERQRKRERERCFIRIYSYYINTQSIANHARAIFTGTAVALMNSTRNIAQLFCVQIYAAVKSILFVSLPNLMIDRVIN